MELGAEIRREGCPEKYTQKKNLFVELLPTLISIILVSAYSGYMFNKSGMDIAVTIVIEAVFVAVFYGIMFAMFSGMKKRMAQTFISVCEGGIKGVYPYNGVKNEEFCILYKDIEKVAVKGARLFIKAGNKKIYLTLCDCKAVAQLINEKRSAAMQ